MSQQLNDFLQAIASDARSSAGLSDADEVSEAQFAEAPAATVAAAGVVRTIDVPITNGHGDLTSATQTTFWVTITGTGTIVAPANGTWNITVKDLEAGKTVFEASALAANKPVDFSYKTGFKTQLEIIADWSEGGNTTLQLELDTNH